MMPRSLIIALALSAVCLMAQSTASKTRWELLIQKPVPEGTIPNIHIVSLPLPPASPIPPPAGKGHTHAGPVFGYVARGEVETLVDPDPAARFHSGEVFYETPGHLHRYLRNLSTVEPANIIAYQTGYEGGAAPAIKVLHHEELVTVTNQEVRLLRLTLAAGGTAEVPSHANPDAICVLAGGVEVESASPQQTYGPMEFFARPATVQPFVLRNPSANEPARILVYQVVDRNMPIPAN